jgi:hypothetical protein
MEFCVERHARPGSTDSRMLATTRQKGRHFPLAVSAFFRMGRIKRAMTPPFSAVSNLESRTCGDDGPLLIR